MTETERISWAISTASEAVRVFLDRDVTLASNATPGPRQFRYDGHGSLDVDDFTAINSVSLTPNAYSGATRTFQPYEYIAMASSSVLLPVMDTIEMWTALPFADSPAMGFQWNADRLGFRPQPVLITVDAVWGWPSIPQSIKQATIWTMGEMLIPETPYVQESIAGYSVVSERSMRSGGGGQDGSGPTNPVSMAAAIPGRAQALLAPYLRVNV
jgi:hypothetical protein